MTLHTFIGNRHVAYLYQPSRVIERVFLCLKIFIKNNNFYL